MQEIIKFSVVFGGQNHLQGFGGGEPANVKSQALSLIRSVQMVMRSNFG